MRNIQLFNIVRDDLLEIRRVDQAKAGKPLERRDRDVVADIQIAKDGVGQPVFRDQRDAVADRLIRAVELDRRTVEEDLAFYAVDCAEEAVGEQRPPGTSKAGDTEDRITSYNVCYTKLLRI